MTKVVAGKYYGETPDGVIVELEHPPREPDVWVCRRVRDFPDGIVPAGGAVATCSRCGEPVAYNLVRQLSAPKSCMQCNGIRPDPIPPAKRSDPMKPAIDALIEQFPADERRRIDDEELHQELEASIAEADAGDIEDFAKVLADLRQAAQLRTPPRPSKE